jgi:hypothetical protein
MVSNDKDDNSNSKTKFPFSTREISLSSVYGSCSSETPLANLIINENKNKTNLIDNETPFFDANDNNDNVFTFNTLKSDTEIEDNKDDNKETTNDNTNSLPTLTVTCCDDKSKNNDENNDDDDAEDVELETPWSFWIDK